MGSRTNWKPTGGIGTIDSTGTGAAERKQQKKKMKKKGTKRRKQGIGCTETPTAMERTRFMVAVSELAQDFCLAERYRGKRNTRTILGEVGTWKDIRGERGAILLSFVECRRIRQLQFGKTVD